MDSNNLEKAEKTFFNYMQTMLEHMKMRQNDCLKESIHIFVGLNKFKD